MVLFVIYILSVPNYGSVNEVKDIHQNLKSMMVLTDYMNKIMSQT